MRFLHFSLNLEFHRVSVSGRILKTSDITYLPGIGLGCTMLYGPEKWAEKIVSNRLL